MGRWDNYPIAEQKNCPGCGCNAPSLPGKGKTLYEKMRLCSSCRNLFHEIMNFEHSPETEGDEQLLKVYILKVIHGVRRRRIDFHDESTSGLAAQAAIVDYMTRLEEESAKPHLSSVSHIVAVSLCRKKE
jgi:hypothetical protein